MTQTQKNRFDGKAALYQQYRPSYPAALLDYLLDKAGLSPGDAVADVGAGTGIFTRQLLSRGLRVSAVEPGAEMRSQAEAALCANPAFFSVSRSAEHTNLAPGSVKLVTAAQAFHWFDPKAFGAECRRILQPGGLVALIWNTRPPDSALTQKCAAAFARHCPDFTGFSGGFSQDPDEIAPFFLGGRMGFRRFANDQLYTWEAFWGRMCSSSYAPREDAPAYPALRAALQKIFEEECAGGLLRFPMQTYSFLGMPA